MSQYALLVCSGRVLHIWARLAGECICGVVGICTLGLNQQGGLLISQQVLLICCSRALYPCGQLAGQFPHFSIGYTGLVQQNSVHYGLNEQGASSFLNSFLLLCCSRALYPCGQLAGQSPHFSIGSTALVQQGSVHLGSISEGGPPHFSIGYTAFVQYGSVHLPLISRATFSFLNRLYWFTVVGICTLGLNNKGASSFLNRLYCFGVEHSTLGVNQLGRVSSFLNRLYWFGVIGHCTLGLDQQGRHLWCSRAM